MSSTFSREAQLEQLNNDDCAWDIVVIGGGATGVGVAVDAAARGYRVALLEQCDFGKGTSSRSTKLIHGGLRYLKQGRIRLVRDALIERGLLCKNAPHLVYPLPTIVPLHSRWEAAYYGIGLKIYERLSGRLSLGPSRRLSLDDMRRAIPTLETRGLYGGASYLDGAFDDARLLVNLVQTAIEHGAVCVNYAPVRELVKEAGHVRGVVAEDLETGKSLRLAARVVVNATGPFSDQILKLDKPGASPVIAASQGIHLVFDREFLPGETALIVPKTRDGRVIFAVPWHNHAVIGTTDTPRADLPLEPRPLPGEVDFLLETIAPYLSHKPQRSDIRSVFAGIRPLVRGGNTSNTSKLGRDHEVRISSTGLVSVLGGKWTTYRKMAEDCVDQAARIGELKPADCTTKSMPVHGHPGSACVERLREYGSDAPALEQVIASTPGANEQLAERLPYVAGQAIFAARHEMARTVEDVLARRTRALFLDAEAAVAAAPRVAELLAAELRRDATWQADQLEKFRLVAEAYRPSTAERV
ncbi:MAG: glycerol-3-phosphate dehydrogenase/oxidase [Planctomycetes bacterium]|nr:glycerol-3-phosphate dehydrogenase/oxidase [Planctomycetota bacterium]